MEPGLVELLRAAWIAGTLPILIASLPCSRLGSFHGLVLGFARRGKIMKSSSHHKFTVPQRFFSHFYVVAVVWTTLLLIATWIYAHRMAPIASEPFFYSDLGSYLAGRSNTFSFHRSQLINSENKFRVWLSVFLLLLMEVQVLRRLFETLYVFKYSPSARMHIFGYLTGLFFYTAMPLTLCCTCAPNVFKFGTSEVTEFIVKGRSLMQAIEFDWWDFVNPFSKLGWCQWIGAAIFLWGWIHQHRCHAILVGSYSYKKEVCGNQMIFREMRSNNYMFSGGRHFPSDARMRYVIHLLVVCVAVVVVIPKLETWLSVLSCKSKPNGQGALDIGHKGTFSKDIIMDMINLTNLSPKTWQVGWSCSFCPALSAGEQSRPWFSYTFLPDPDHRNKNREFKTVDEKHQRRIFSSEVSLIGCVNSPDSNATN
ncbi:hypothetical protein D5086_009054 [Populus alba]|uniref:Uncharacterized protein n=1 Tax=Populus alba TaxID=43335 RepID=A0ACC4CIY2_POPAL